MRYYFNNENKTKTSSLVKPCIFILKLSMWWLLGLLKYVIHALLLCNAKREYDKFHMINNILKE